MYCRIEARGLSLCGANLIEGDPGHAGGGRGPGFCRLPHVARLRAHASATEWQPAARACLSPALPSSAARTLRSPERPPRVPPPSSLHPRPVAHLPPPRLPRSIRPASERRRPPTPRCCLLRPAPLSFPLLRSRHRSRSRPSSAASCCSCWAPAQQRTSPHGPRATTAPRSGRRSPHSAPHGTRTAPRTTPSCTSSSAGTAWASLRCVAPPVLVPVLVMTPRAGCIRRVLRDEPDEPDECVPVSHAGSES